MDKNDLFHKPEETVPGITPAGKIAGPSQNPFKTAPPIRPLTNMPPPAVQTAMNSTHGRGHSSLIRLIVGVLVVLVISIVVLLFLPKGESSKVTLVWWGLWEENRVMQPIIADFERKHPNITIEYTKEDPNQYKERLVSRIASGKGPDIFVFHNTWYPMLPDVLLPLSTDVITQEEFKKNFYPVMQQDLIHNGGIYGIPLGADTLSLFINKELFDAAGASVPTNWEEFVKVAKQLTVKDENGKLQTSGAALGTYGNITHAPDIISLLFVQQGVNMKKFTDSTKDEIDALDFYTSFATGANNTWDTTLDQSILAFSQGKLAMYFGYSWDIFTIQKLNKDLPFKVYPVPSLFNRTMTIASYWVDGISAKSTHQKEALLFMNYLAQKETAQKLYTEAAKTRAFGQPYARVDLAATLKNNELVYPFVSQLSTATSSFFASDTDDGEGGINSANNLYLGNAINAIVTDGLSTQSVVETLSQGVAQTFSKYVVQ